MTTKRIPATILFTDIVVSEAHTMMMSEAFWLTEPLA
jgi:hypothetical protein